MSRAADGVATLFNVVRFPVMENSYSIYFGTSAKVETTDYSIDLDNGDLQAVAAPANGVVVQSRHKYAHWRDKNWVEAINGGIDYLNARGFFRQVVRANGVMRLSAGIRTYNGPSAAVDVYEVLGFSNYLSSGSYQQLATNISYQQDANKVVLGTAPTVAQPLAVSYLRNMQTYAATSATLDILNDWVEIVKKKAAASFFRSLAAKVAKEGAATIDEGHFSFTNLRTMAKDLDDECDRLASRKKPTRPSKNMSYHIAGGGPQ
jgi:hypothetical protein